MVSFLFNISSLIIGLRPVAQIEIVMMFKKTNRNGLLQCDLKGNTSVIYNHYLRESLYTFYRLFSRLFWTRSSENEKVKVRKQSFNSIHDSAILLIISFLFLLFLFISFSLMLLSLFQYHVYFTPLSLVLFWLAFIKKAVAY